MFQTTLHSAAAAASTTVHQMENSASSALHQTESFMERKEIERQSAKEEAKSHSHAQAPTDHAPIPVSHRRIANPGDISGTNAAASSADGFGELEPKSEKAIAQ